MENGDDDRGLLLEVGHRIDELRGKILVQNERIAQLELEGRDPSNARDDLAALERYLRESVRQRDQVARELGHRRWMEARRKLS